MLKVRVEMSWSALVSVFPVSHMKGGINPRTHSLEQLFIISGDIKYWLKCQRGIKNSNCVARWQRNHTRALKRQGSDAAIKRQEWQQALGKQSSILVIFSAWHFYRFFFPPPFQKAIWAMLLIYWQRSLFVASHQGRPAASHCACWIRARVCARILDSCINLPRPPMSSAKVQKEIMQMTICCVLFGVFF